MTQPFGNRFPHQKTERTVQNTYRINFTDPFGEHREKVYAKYSLEVAVSAFRQEYGTESNIKSIVWEPIET